MDLQALLLGWTETAYHLALVCHVEVHPARPSVQLVKILRAHLLNDWMSARHDHQRMIATFTLLHIREVEPEVLYIRGMDR